METAMGKVLVCGRVENLADLFEVQRGQRAPDQVRAVELQDALVNTGATMLSLPTRMIRELALMPFKTRRLQTTVGVRGANIFGTVQLTLQGRECHVDVSEVPDDCPPLIGQIPLELLDFVVDPKRHRLIGNPDHDGQFMYDEF